MASQALREHKRKARRDQRRKSENSGYFILVPLLSAAAAALILAGIGLSWYQGGEGGALAGAFGLAGIVFGIGSFVISRLVTDHSESYITPAQIGGVAGICVAAAAVVILISGLL